MGVDMMIKTMFGMMTFYCYFSWNFVMAEMEMEDDDSRYE